VDRTVAKRSQSFPHPTVPAPLGGQAFPVGVGEAQEEIRDLGSATASAEGQPSGKAIYIVAPTLNEAANLPTLVEGINRAMGGRAYRIVLVDDGSTDGTLEIAGSLRAAGRPISVVERGTKLGIGSAIRDGLAWCLGREDADLIVTMDADLSHDPAEIPRLLDAAADAELVQGSRYVPGGRVMWSWSRRLLSLVANALVHVVLQTGMKEHTTYFRVYSRCAAEAALSAEGCDGYEWALGSLVAIRKRNLGIREVPITFRERDGGSSKMTLPAMIKWIQFVLRRGSEEPGIARTIAQLPRFAAVGALGFVVNQAVLFALHGVAGLYPLLAAVFAVEVSILSNFTLNDRWTFRRRTRSSSRWGRLGTYHGACALGILMNLGVFALLTLGLGVNYLVANFFAILIGFATNFRGSTTWTWVAD